MFDPAAQRAKDESDLNMLSILHYVWSALLGCSSVGLVVYFIIVALFVASAGGPRGDADAEMASRVAMGVTIGLGVLMAIVTIPLCVLHVLAAAGLRSRSRYTLALVMSGFACLSVPLGTGLGVWTIIVLQRPSVKALFGRV